VRSFPKASLSSARQRRSEINAGRHTSFSFQRAGRRLAGTTTVSLYASGFRGSSTFARLSTTRLPLRLEASSGRESFGMRSYAGAHAENSRIGHLASERNPKTLRTSDLDDLDSNRGVDERSRRGGESRHETPRTSSGRILRISPRGVKPERSWSETSRLRSFKPLVYNVLRFKPRAYTGASKKRHAVTLRPPSPTAAALGPLPSRSSAPMIAGVAASGGHTVESPHAHTTPDWG